MWVQGVASGALLAFATPTALLLVVLLAPAIICVLAEAGPSRGVARAVAVACGSTALAPLWHLWLTGDRMSSAFATLSQPTTVLLAWGAGALAWALCQVLPVLIHALWEMRETAQARAVETELRACREAWRLDDYSDRE